MTVPLPSADRAAFTARCDAEFVQRLPIVALGLAAIHVAHLVLIGVWTPNIEDGARWQTLSLAWHVAQLLVVGGFGVAARLGLPLSPFFVRWTIIVTYVLFGCVVSGTDVIRGIPPIGLGASLIGLAAVFQFEVPVAAVLFGAASGIAVGSAAYFNPPDLSVITLNACAIGGVAFVVAVTTSGARWRASEEERRTAAANQNLAALNQRLELEIERRIAVEAELERLATRDPLTNLLNRRAFLSALTHATTREGTATVLLVDLDHFKQINDSAGHAAGDAVLLAVAASLRTGVRTDDVVARLGGDELAVLLNGAGAEEAAKVAEGLRHAVSEAHVQHGVTPITVSIGGAERRRGEAVDGWIERADRALYVAKEGGRNRVALDTECVGRSAERH